MCVYVRLRIRLCARMHVCVGVCISVAAYMRMSMYTCALECVRTHSFVLPCFRYIYMSDTEFDMVQRVCLPVVFPI